MTMGLNRFSSVPLYRQIVNVLYEEFKSELTAGAKVPSESALSDRFEVNRLTVRKALEELAQLGVIRTVQGKGSFVAKESVPYNVSTNQKASFGQVMRQKGHRVETKLLNREILAGEACEFLPDVKGDVLKTEGLRLIDGTPWSVSETWLPLDYFPKIDELWTGVNSLYQILEEHFKTPMLRASRTFSALSASPEIAELLMIPAVAPVLKVEGPNISPDGRVIAYVAHQLSGERTQFTMEA